MPARPLTIAGIDFAKKGDATEFFKGLLRSKAYGERFEGSEHVALTGLFMRHPEAAEKMQCGIDFFFVDKSPGFSTPCFWIQRKDGSTVDFSIRHCLDQKGKTPLQIFSSACREAVQRDIAIAKSDIERRNNGVFECETTKKKLARKDVHADHQNPTFDQLVWCFIRIENVDLVSPSLYKNNDPSSPKPTQLNDDLLRKFQEFHRKEAQIRIVSRKVNLENAPKQASKTVKRPLTLRPDPVIGKGQGDQKQLGLDF